MRAKKVYEDLKEFLPPKPMEEIKDKMKSIFTNLFEFGNAEEFINYKPQDQDMEDAQEDTKKMCNIMNSDPKDVYYIVEEWKDYETVWHLLNKIESEWRKNHESKHEVLKGTDMTYRINPETKIAFGSNTDFNGLDALFFDYPYILELIDKWEKLLK